MADTTFFSRLTTITATWLNQVNRYIFGSTTAAAIRSLDKTIYSTYRTLGYYSLGDGGGGDYALDLSDTTSADNGGTVFVAADGGRWKLITNGPVTLKQWGCKIDGITNDSARLQAALNFGGTLLHPGGKCLLLSGVVCTNDQVSLLGLGPRASVFDVGADFGDVFTFQSTNPGVDFLNELYIVGCSIRAIIPMTSGDALALNLVQQVHLTNVQIEDCYGGIRIEGALFHYYTSVHITSPRSTGPAAWSGVKAGSHYVKIDRASGGHIASTILAVNCNWQRTDVVDYIEHGVVVNSVDGLWLTGGHIMGVAQDDFHIEPTSTDRQISGIICTGMWFDNNCTNNVHILGATSASFLEIIFTGCKFFQPNSCCIFVEDSSLTFDGVKVNGGAMTRSGQAACLLRGGRKNIFDGGLAISACNLSADASSGGIVVDSGIVNPGGPGEVAVGNVYFDKFAQSFTATAMNGVVVTSTSVTTLVTCEGEFNLSSGVSDILDMSNNAANDYRGSKTSKVKTAATPVVGTSLVIPEVGEVLALPASLTFNNITARRGQRILYLVAAGVSTIQNGAGIKTLTGSDITTAANKVYGFTYVDLIPQWVQFA